jgi:SSS family solute:Na+ symporter
MSVQLAVILAYFGLTSGSVLAQRKAKSASSFVARIWRDDVRGRRTGSGWVGPPPRAFRIRLRYGLSGAWFSLANGVGIVFLAFFFAKLYRSWRP